jgi:hypothetical protein
MGSKPVSKKKPPRCRCRGIGAPEIIDPCIRELVDTLNRHGVTTLSSCCGHGGKGDIILKGSCVEPWKDGMWRLILKSQPVQHPFDDDRQEWEELP